MLASCASEIGCSVMVLGFVPSYAEQHEGILLRWKCHDADHHRNSIYQKDLAVQCIAIDFVYSHCLNFQDFNMSQNCYKLLTDVVH
jgi:hypothetical protein